MSVLALPTGPEIVETRGRVLHVSAGRDEIVIVMHGHVLVDAATLRRAVAELERPDDPQLHDDDLPVIVREPAAPTVADLPARSLAQADGGE